MDTPCYPVNTQISHASAGIELPVNDLDRENGFAAEDPGLQLRVDVRGVCERSDGSVADAATSTRSWRPGYSAAKPFSRSRSLTGGCNARRGV